MRSKINLIIGLVAGIIFLVVILVISAAQPRSEKCYVLTGEADYGLMIVQPPPPTLRAGEQATIVVEAGYYDVFPDCTDTGGTRTYRYPEATDLDEVERQVALIYDETVIAEVRCHYRCEIEFVLPEGIPAGEVTLFVRPTSWRYLARDVPVVVEVVE